MADALCISLGWFLGLFNNGSEMAWFPNAVAHVQSRVTSCEIFGVQGGIDTRYFVFLWFSPAEHHFKTASYSLVISPLPRGVWLPVYAWG
jgi:hypothetical protein